MKKPVQMELSLPGEMPEETRRAIVSQLSPKMREAYNELMRQKKLKRYPGGLWAAISNFEDDDLYFPTKTIKALVNRNLARWNSPKVGEYGFFFTEVIPVI